MSGHLAPVLVLRRPACPASWCEDPGCRLSHEHPLPAGPPSWLPESGRCRCTHHVTAHQGGAGGCSSVACGCSTYRPQEVSR